MKEFFKKRFSLTITLVIFVFFVMVATFLLILGSVLLLQQLGVTSLPASPPQDSKGNNEHPLASFLFFLGICVLLGTALTAFFSKKALNPIRKVIDAIHKVADGDFDVQVNLKGIGELEELSHSFNKMTQELSSIETLRSDFINNFSHEFKTPIVSIRGFAKLLKENNLDEEERREYLEIIIKESERLAELSTNVLTLSKYESLEIVTDIAPFRLDEQIRKTIVLMEPKWFKKEITINLELEEVIYNGNEDLTQQIWINLLDNAIKFSYHGGVINITLMKGKHGIKFIINDEGIGMDDQVKANIFEKFYQSDTSRSKLGYGIGLSLVKRIVEICNGQISVKSELDKGSIFTIILPYS
ncbi:HAMP domain-containing sensor histidine kinase [Priestia megaterium]